jgi:hypothetical protein
MAKYYEDWSGYTTGAFPSATWSLPIDTAVTATVETTSEPLAPAGRMLRMLNNTTGVRAFATLDAVDSDSTRANFAIAALIKQNWTTVSGARSGVAGRIAGSSSANVTAYASVYRQDSTNVSTRANDLVKYVTGTFTSINRGGAGALDSPALYWVCLICDGDQITRQLRDATDPSTIVYQSTVTDTSITAAGFIGLFRGTQNAGTESEIYVVTVATGDDEIFFDEPVAPTEPVLTSPVGTATGATTATVGATTDQPNGTLYVAVTGSATPPADTAIKAGTGFDFADDQAITTTGAKTFSATGLTTDDTYYAHLVHENDAGFSNIVTSSAFTPTAPPPPATKLRIDELLYVDKAKTALVDDTGYKAYVLDPSDNTLSKYFASVAVVDGVVEITDALYETPTDVFEVVLIKGNVRGVFPATVVDD